MAVLPGTHDLYMIPYSDGPARFNRWHLTSSNESRDPAVIQVSLGRLD